MFVSHLFEIKNTTTTSLLHENRPYRKILMHNQKSEYVTLKIKIKTTIKNFFKYFEAHLVFFNIFFWNFPVLDIIAGTWKHTNFQSLLQAKLKKIYIL